MSYTNSAFVSNTSYSSDGFNSFSHSIKDPVNGIHLSEFSKIDPEEKNIFYKKHININFSFKKSFIVKKEYIGSGDIIDFITHITGIKKFIIWWTNGKCGCEARRKKFNSVLRFVYFKLYLTNISYRDEIIEHFKLTRKQQVEKEESTNNLQLNEDYEKAYQQRVNIKPPSGIRTASKGCGCSAKKS
jgi:hypothetical protein